MASRMSLKDGSLLLLTGIVAAVAAWAFWRYLGDNALAVLPAVVIVALWLDNRRMRRQIGDKPPSSPKQG